MDERPDGPDYTDGDFASAIIGRAVSDSESRWRDDPLTWKRSADQGEGGGFVGVANRPEGREYAPH